MAIPGYEPDEVYEEETGDDDAEGAAVDETDPADVEGESEELMGEVGEGDASDGEGEDEAGESEAGESEAGDGEGGGEAVETGGDGDS